MLTCSVAYVALLASLGSLLCKLYLVLGLTVQVFCAKGLIVTTKHFLLADQVYISEHPHSSKHRHTLHYVEPVDEESLETQE
jgi:hypothetical protein